jgi:hypothetical protein
MICGTLAPTTACAHDLALDPAPVMAVWQRDSMTGNRRVPRAGLEAHTLARKKSPAFLPTPNQACNTRNRLFLHSTIRAKFRD